VKKLNDTQKINKNNFSTILLQDKKSMK